MTRSPSRGRDRRWLMPSLRRTTTRALLDHGGGSTTGIPSAGRHHDHLCRPMPRPPPPPPQVVGLDGDLNFFLLVTCHRKPRGYMLEGNQIERTLYYPYLTRRHQTHITVAVVGLHNTMRQVVGSSPRSAQSFCEIKSHMPPCLSGRGLAHSTLPMLLCMGWPIRLRIMSAQKIISEKNIGPISRYSLSIGPTCQWVQSKSIW
jgi:hypothetical protein